MKQWLAMAGISVTVAALAGTGTGADIAGSDKPPCMATEARRARERLAALPSEPGPHIEKIRAMGDNEWLDLGAPTPDPTWGLRRGAGYTPRMAFAPEMRGAFVFGEGPHGTRNVDGKIMWGYGSNFMTDLFFYDIHAHAWLCVSPPFFWDEQTLTVDENGFEVDETGQPVPYSLSHGWQYYDYNSHLRQFMAVFSGCTFSGRVMRERRKAWTEGKELAQRGHPWFWDVASGRWQRHVTTGDIPQLHEHDHILQYVPSLKSSFYIAAHGNARGIYRFDHASNHWTRVSMPQAGRGPVAFDTKRSRLYFCNGGKAYDFAKDEWIELADPDIWKQFSRRGTARANMTYDAVNDVVVARHLNVGMRVYDVEKDVWLEETLDQPPRCERGRLGGVSYAAFSSFYDSELNAHFHHLAGDGLRNGKIWVYRFKRAE